MEGKRKQRRRKNLAGEVLSDLEGKQVGVPGPYSPFSEGPRVEAEPQGSPVTPSSAEAMVQEQVTRQPAGTLVCEHIKSKAVTAPPLRHLGSVLLLFRTKSYDRMGKSSTSLVNGNSPNQNLVLEKSCGIYFMPLIME